MLSAVSTLLTAPAGTGKSYWCIYELVNVFLKDTNGDFWSNLPVGPVPETHTFPPAFPGESFVDRIAKLVDEPEVVAGGDNKPGWFAKWFKRREFVNKRRKVAERIKVIPKDVLESWANEESGPWDFFKEIDLTGARIVVDEIHNFASSKSQRQHQRRWQEFCGELRHRGATILFVTQSPMKLAKAVRDECGLRNALVNNEDRCDPWFGIKLYYWYQLIAKFSGEYRAKFCMLEMADVDGEKRKKTAPPRTIPRDPKYFALYDSYNTPQKGGTEKGQAEKQPWESMPWPGLLLWFGKRNAGNFVKPFAVLAAIVIVVFKGQAIWFWFMAVFTGAITSGSKPDGDFAAEGPAVAVQVSGAGQGGMTEPVPVTLTKRERDELDGLREKAAERAELERRASLLRMITPDSVVLESGEILKQGENIGYGIHKGRSIKKINMGRRYVVLDDDSLLHLGDRWLQYAKPTVAQPIATALPAGPEAVAGPSIEASGRDGDGLSGKAATRFVRTPDGRTHLRVDRGRGSVRGSDGKPGSGESDGGRRTGDGGKTSLNSDDAYGESILHR